MKKPYYLTCGNKDCGTCLPFYYFNARKLKPEEYLIVQDIKDGDVISFPLLLPPEKPHEKETRYQPFIATDN